MKRARSEAEIEGGEQQERGAIMEKLTRLDRTVSKEMEIHEEV